METSEDSREHESSTVHGTRAALVLAITAALSCGGPTDTDVSHAQYEDVQHVIKCLRGKMAGLRRKACDPVEAEKLFKLAKDQCGMNAPKTYGGFSRDCAAYHEVQLSPKEREKNIRTAINMICRD